MTRPRRPTRPAAADRPAGNDHIGRPVFATNASGAKVWEATYTPFGGVHTSAGNLPANRFPGQWFQTESGLHQNWMRDYDPTTGRYLEADPLGLVDGASVYGYARQSPMMSIDPRGLETDPKTGHQKWGPFHPPKGVKIKCRDSDSSPVLLGKIWLFGKVIASHEGFDAIKDSNRHTGEIRDLKNGLLTCLAKAAKSAIASLNLHH